MVLHASSGALRPGCRRSPVTDSWRNAALTFAVAGIGIAAAWLGFETKWFLPLVLILLVAGIALAVYKAGEARARRDPVGAVKLMRWRIVGLILMAGGASALVIALSVWLKAPEGADPDTEELVTASVAALTAIVTSILIKDAETADESWVATPIMQVFQNSFRGVFPENSRGQRAVYEGTFEGEEGWGREARQTRAAAIAEQLREL